MSTKSEWNRFRRVKARDTMRSHMDIVGTKKKQSIDHIITPHDKSIRATALIKEEFIRNSASPPSERDRWYPQQFTIKKPEQE